MLNITTLHKQLAYEARQNPKKVVALGGLMLVGVYFWAPLIIGWLAPEGGTPAGTVAATEPPSATEKQQLKKQQAAGGDWQKVAGWIDAAPWSDAARPDTLATQNPLNTPVVEPAQPDDDEDLAREETQSKPDGPLDLGLELTSTVVGRRQRLALINGRVYPEGSRVVGADATALEVLKVRPGEVTLARGALRFTLRVP